VGLTAGQRLRAQNSTTEVIVIKGSDSAASLLCGGAEMLTDALTSDALLASGPAVELGKRYTAGSDQIEVLCTKAGLGPLTIGGQPLSIRTAKALPASD
jgi:hypothetical protein